MNNLKLRIFGIKEISQKFQNCMKIWPSAQYNYQIENLVNTSEKLDTELSHGVLFYMKSKFCPK